MSDRVPSDGCPHCMYGETERVGGCCCVRYGFKWNPEAWLDSYLDRPKWVHVVGPGGEDDVLEAYDFSSCPRLATAFAKGLTGLGKTVYVLLSPRPGVKYRPALRSKTA